jgi:hypothetical protein
MNWSLDSSDFIAIRLRTGRPRNRGSIPGRAKSTCSSPQRSDQLCTLPSQPRIQWTLGAHSSWLKRLGREADH